MRVLFPVSGAESDGYFASAAHLISGAEVSALLTVHVLDEARRAGMEHGRERFLDHRALGPRRRAQIDAAESEAAEAVVDRAARALAAIGWFTGVVPETLVLQGRINEAVRDLAGRWDADLIVVRGRPGRPGPHSMGKSARFLIDHAPKAALLVRDPGSSPAGKG
jgi:nucleotide-binding universal stress UspA family protein